MPQRIVSLELTGAELKAAVLQTTFRDYRVEGLHAERLSAEGSGVEDQVRAFLGRHIQSGDTVLSALPGDLVTWRTFFLPFRDQRRLGQTVPFELENNVPFGLDEVVVDHQVLHRDSSGTLVLAALVPKADLERHLQLLRNAGADPKIVDLGPLASLNTLSLVPDLPANFVFVDLSARLTTVALYRERELVGLRTLSRELPASASGNGAGPPPEVAASLLAEVRWTLLALAEAPVDPGLPCYLAGDPACIDAIEEGLERDLSLAPRRLDQVALRSVATETRAEAVRFSSTLGLALREAAPAGTLGLNFRRGEFTFHHAERELRRALGAVAALAAVVVALTVGDLYAEYRQLSARAAGIEQQIQKVYSATIPDAGRVADPVAQLSDEIAALEERNKVVNDVVPVSQLTSIDTLWAIAAAIPNQIRVDAEDFSMDPDSVRVRANTDTYESVETIKQRLLETNFFRDIEVKDAKAAKDGKGVEFRMTLFLNKGPRPRAEGAR